MTKPSNLYYKQNVDTLRGLGADIMTFSPLMDNSLRGVSGLIVGGGYPQLFLVQLQENESIMRNLRRLIEDECPTCAKCGGLIYLCEEIVDFGGFKVKGVSVMPATCKMSKSMRFLS